METAPLLMGCHGFQGFREAGTVASGGVLSGGLEWGPGGAGVRTGGVGITALRAL